MSLDLFKITDSAGHDIYVVAHSVAAAIQAIPDWDDWDDLPAKIDRPIDEERIGVQFPYEFGSPQEGDIPEGAEVARDEEGVLVVWATAGDWLEHFEAQGVTAEAFCSTRWAE